MRRYLKVILKRRGWLNAGVMVAGLVACVTVNTYFPATAAEKAADRIIEDVWNKDVMTPTVGSMLLPVEYQSMPTHPSLGQGRTLDFLVMPVAAVESDLNISSPRIEGIVASMGQRHSTLRPYFQNGVIGLTHDGLIAMREVRLVPLEEGAWLDKLIVAENSDRKALYRELARANRHPEWERQIQQTFARRWIRKAPAGWWYQNTQGYWEQKE
jgi:uncharacterized protein